MATDHIEGAIRVLEQDSSQNCPSVTAPEKKHNFVIVHGSGIVTGIPFWKCTYCSKKIESM